MGKVLQKLWYLFIIEIWNTHRAYDQFTLGKMNNVNCLWDSNLLLSSGPPLFRDVAESGGPAAVTVSADRPDNPGAQHSCHGLSQWRSVSGHQTVPAESTLPRVPGQLVCYWRGKTEAYTWISQSNTIVTEYEIWRQLPLSSTEPSKYT